MPPGSSSSRLRLGGPDAGPAPGPSAMAAAAAEKMLQAPDHLKSGCMARYGGPGGCAALFAVWGTPGEGATYADRKGMFDLRVTGCSGARALPQARLRRGGRKRPVPHVPPRCQHCTHPPARAPAPSPGKRATHYTTAPARCLSARRCKYRRWGATGLLQSTCGWLPKTNRWRRAARAMRSALPIAPPAVRRRQHFASP